jgi:hypothetical protein
MMARSDLLHPRAGYSSARPTNAVLKIQLATRGRSIQMGQKLTQLRRARNATTFLNCDRATPKFGAARSAQPAGEPKTA